MARKKTVTDRALRYRAQAAVTGEHRCVICGRKGKPGRGPDGLDVMHLDGNESHGDKKNLAYGCRACNAGLASAFKAIGAGRLTNQYNPGKVPTYKQYAWAVAQQQHSGEHGQAGAVIHATPKHKRIEYARRILDEKTARDTRYRTPAWMRENPGASMPKARKELAKENEKRRAMGMEPLTLREFLPLWYPDMFSNPGASGEAFKRCVRSVEAQGSAYDPKAVCATAGRKKYGKAAFQKMAAAGRRRAVRGNPSRFTGHRRADGQYDIRDAERGGDVVRTVKTKSAAMQALASMNARGSAFTPSSGRRRNPADASAEVFEEFHGYPPDEVITVQKKLHFHKHLAAAGELVGLAVKPANKRIPEQHIEDLDGAFLAFNEGKNQLFIEGGNQYLSADDLKALGIDSPHEIETLGKLVAVGYYTDKRHLGKDGGEAVYDHIFRTTNENGRHVVVELARYPDLIYKSRDEQFEISGGSYIIRAEGIDR